MNAIAGPQTSVRNNQYLLKHDEHDKQYSPAC